MKRTRLGSAAGAGWSLRGRPRRGGAAVGMAAPPAQGLSREVETLSSMSPIWSRKWRRLRWRTVYTVKRVDGKPHQPDRMTQYSSIRVTEHFFDMLIKLIRRVPTKKMEYFEGIVTRRNFLTIFRQLSDHFPSTFRPFSVNFLTIFRQLSDKRIKIKLAPAGGEPTSFVLPFFYSTTAPH